MKGLKKKALSVLLALTMVVGMLSPMNVSAQAEGTVEFDSTILAENASASSEMTNPSVSDGPAKWAFDEQEHWWHTNWRNSSEGLVTDTNPAWIQTGFGMKWMVKEITYLPRNKSDAIIEKYELYVANLEDPNGIPNESDFGEPVASGTFEKNAEEKSITLNDFKEATHIRLKVLSVYPYVGGQGAVETYAAAKRIRVYGKDVEGGAKATAAYADGSDATMGTLTATAGILTAEANPGYRFVQWQTEAAGGELVSRDAHITRHPDSDVTYYAVFKAANPKSVNVASYGIESIDELEYGTASNGDQSNHQTGRLYDGIKGTGADQLYLIINDSTTNRSVIQINLREKYPAIDYMMLYRYVNGASNGDPERIYKGIVILVSDDPDFSTYHVAYNSDKENKLGFGPGTEEIYKETTRNGLEIVLPDGMGGQYIRLYLQGCEKSGWNVYAYNHIEEFEIYAEETEKFTVSATANDNSLGSVSITSGGNEITSGSALRAGTEVTFTADSPKYKFLGWYDDSDKLVSVSATYTIALAEATSLKAKFDEKPCNLNVETEYWDQQKSIGKLGKQDTTDIWLYQVKHSERGWENIPDNLFKPDTYDGAGSWIGDDQTDTNEYYWGRVTREKITPCFGSRPYDAIAYAWKAQKQGYVKMILGKDPKSNNNTGDPDLNVTIAKEAKGSDGSVTEEVMKTVTVPKGGNPVDKNEFATKIVKVNVGDLIRFSVAKVNNDLCDAEPIIVECTVREYAEQYYKDVNIDNMDKSSYTTSSVVTLNMSNAELKAALDNSETDDGTITEKLTALENAVKGLKKRVDLSALNAATKDANDKIASEQFTPNSVAELDKVVKAAEEWELEHVFELEASPENQQLVDEWTDKVNTAINKLVKKADKSILNAKIEEAENKNSNSNYTDESKIALQNAISDANDVKADDNATEEEVTDTIVALDTAIEALELKDANYDALDTAIEAANALVQDEYTTSSWAGLTTALNNANSVKGQNLKITDQGIVDDAVTKLKAAIDALAEKADKSILVAKIEEAESKNTDSNYTDESKTALQSAIATAKNVKTNDDATKEDVDTVVAALDAAIEALKLKDADYTALDAAIASAERLDKTCYTEASWNSLTEALNAANAVEKKLNITQQKIIDDAVTALNNAIAGLQEKVKTYVVRVNGEEKARGPYNTVVTITAPAAPEGQKFAGWLVNREIISTKAEYTFAIANDIDFTASFVDETVEVIQNPLAVISNTLTLMRDDGKANIRYVAQLTVPEGYTLNQTGLLWTGKNTTNVPVLYGENGEVKTGAKKVSVSTVNTSYQFSVTVNSIPAGKTVRGVVFAKVTNKKTGEVSWIYSQEIAVTNN